MGLVFFEVPAEEMKKKTEGGWERKRERMVDQNIVPERQSGAILPVLGLTHRSYAAVFLHALP